MTLHTFDALMELMDEEPRFFSQGSVYRYTRIGGGGRHLYAAYLPGYDDIAFAPNVESYEPLCIEGEWTPLGNDLVREFVGK